MPIYSDSDLEDPKHKPKGTAYATGPNTLLGLPERGTITGVQMMMAMPQIILGLLGLPEEEAIAGLSPKIAELMERFPKAAWLGTKAARTGISAGAGYLGGGKTGAEVGAGSELVGLPFELAPPIKRLMGRANNLARETAASTGETIASHIEDFLPNTAATIREGTSRFGAKRAGNNWASIISRPTATAEVSKAYEDGISFIDKDLRNSIHGYYQQMISNLKSQSGVATPQQAQVITHQINVLERRQKWEMDLATSTFKKLKSLKTQAGNAAFKPTSEIREGLSKLDRMNAYNEASAKLHDFMNEMDMKYGSQLTPNLDKLDNQYNSFWHLHDLASDPNLRHPKTGGLNRQLLQEKLQSPESAHLEKSMRPQKWQEFQRNAGLDPNAGTSMVPGSMPFRMRVNTAFAPSSYMGIPKLPFDPVKNIPGVLNPTRAGQVAGGIGKAILKGILGPKELEKLLRGNQ